MKYGNEIITNTSYGMKNPINGFRNTSAITLRNGQVIDFIKNDQRHLYLTKSTTNKKWMFSAQNNPSIKSPKRF